MVVAIVMALLFELVSSVLGLALKPLLLAKISCQFGARSISIVIHTWFELLRFALSLHLIILWRLALWSIALLSLPVRAFAALNRESLLEMQLHTVKNELENVLWDRTKVEEQLLAAIKERKMMEMMLLELEEEHDEAIVKIELLQREVQDLKDEILRLKEVQGKALWTYCDGDNTDSAHKSSWKPDHKKNIRQATSNDHESHHARKAGSRILYGLSQLYVSNMISNEHNALTEQREIALSRSLLSAIMSIAVGIAVWEAEDRCMPLMLAIFAVVSISLVSVLRLFTGIEHKPKSEAIALLSINWFMLGTIACPMLPSVARFFTPLSFEFSATYF